MSGNQRFGIWNHRDLCSVQRKCISFWEHTLTNGRYAGTFFFVSIPSCLLSRTADVTALKQNLQLLSDLMRQTGVGALPLLHLPSDSSSSQTAPVMPTEEMMLTDTSRSVQVLYDRMKRSQESAAVAANLLNAPEHGGSRTGR